MTAQVLAIVIFIVMFVLMVLEKFERHHITLCCGALVLLLVFGFAMRSFTAVRQTLNVESIFSPTFWIGEAEGGTSGINWATIFFIAGMMVMVEGMGKAGFFHWLCMTIARAVHYHTVPLLVCFMLMSGVLAMFIDSITVVLFMATVTVELSKLLKFNPLPMIVSEIFCANLGGSATMCGDPPNIIIGTSLGFTFFDFVTNTGVIVGICFVFTVVYFWLCFRKGLKKSEDERPEGIVYPDPKDSIKNKKAFAASAAVFALAVILLVTHAQTGLSVAFIGLFIAALMTVAMLITAGSDAVKHIYSHLDYKTLLFFIGLFVAVGGLEQTGVLDLVAEIIAKISGGNPYIVVAVIIWFSAGASAFVDNIPFAATMVPVIRAMSETMGLDIGALAWTLSLGADVGGNATPIGASANVVGTSVAAKEGHPIGWGKYCRWCAPATVMVVLISMICVFVKYI